jgi:hypothetical protein|tara:strand:+ start:309 stop:431 length:123 start_codon:yes stop_codon:yes gene_type:complete
VKSTEEDEEKAFPILKIDNEGGGLLAIRSIWVYTRFIASS